MGATCRVCSAELADMRKRYCASCKEQVYPPTRTEATCLACEKKFKPHRGSIRYCSRECQKSVYRGRGADQRRRLKFVMASDEWPEIEAGIKRLKAAWEVRQLKNTWLSRG